MSSYKSYKTLGAAKRQIEKQGYKLLVEVCDCCNLITEASLCEYSSEPFGYGSYQEVKSWRFKA